MGEETKIKLFQNQQVRVIWDDEIEEYYFSVVDVVGVLSESKNPSQYWRTLKSRLNEEGVQSVTICNRLKMLFNDGKMRKLMLLLQNSYSVSFNQYFLQMPNLSSTGKVNMVFPHVISS